MCQNFGKEIRIVNIKNLISCLKEEEDQGSEGNLPEPIENFGN